MKINITKLIDARQTGRLMYQLVDKFYTDMAPWASLSVAQFFDVMKNLPFVADPDNVELIKRPFYTMNKIGPGGDCDDKSICIGAWAKLNGIPYRFIGVGRRQKNEKKVFLSHVYPELFIFNEWTIFDATYSFNTLGKPLGEYDRREILSRT